MNGTHESGAHDHNELWHVAVEPGHVKLWSLDQLDAAFKAGIVDEKTMVAPEGSPSWSTLADIAGIEPDDEPQVASSIAPSVESIRPVVSHIDDTEMMPHVRRSRALPVAVGVVATCVIIAVGGFVANQNRGSGLPESSAAAAQVASQPASAPVAPSAPAAAAVSIDSLPVAAELPKSRLTDEQKRAIAAADKLRESKLKAKHLARPASPSKSNPDKVFVKNGSKYDPLNAKL